MQISIPFTNASDRRRLLRSAWRFNPILTVAIFFHLLLIPLVIGGWLLSRRRYRIRLSPRQRVALLHILGAAYLSWVALLTWQAMRAQSIVAPDGFTWLAYGLLLAFAGIASALTLRAKSSQVVLGAISIHDSIDNAL